MLALLMDSAVEIPGTGWRIGLDPVIGLIPGVGDALSMMVSAYIVVEGARLGASKWTIARMIGNIAIDTLVGAVPVLGDLFDAGFKSNLMNVRLLGIPIEVPAPRRWVRNEAVA